MFFLLKMAIWIAGVLTIAYLALPYVGYQLNLDYFKESRSACESRIQECSRELVKQGTENSECDFQCLDPKIIIKKKP